MFVTLLFLPLGEFESPNVADAAVSCPWRKGGVDARGGLRLTLRRNFAQICGKATL